MTQKTICKIYDSIEQYYKKYLKKYDVQLPKLKKNNDSYTKDALTLIYLSKDYPNTKKTTKQELTQFIRKYYPNTKVKLLTNLDKNEKIYK